MKPKGLLIAVVLLAVLAGMVWWSNKRQAAPAADTSVKILSIPEDQFREIKIENVAGQIIALRRDDGIWSMTAPKPLPADQEAIRSMVTALTNLTAEKAVEEQATDMHQFGLDIPTLAVTVTTKDGNTHNLLVGSSTLDMSANYARLAGNLRVFTIPGDTKSTLDRRPEELRDKRLLTFDPDSLTRVELQAKGPAVAFQKNSQNEWEIAKPWPMRADRSQITSLVETLRDAKLDPLELEEDAAKKFSAGARAGIAQVTTKDGTQTLEIRKAEDGSFYAKSSVVEGVWRTSNGVGAVFDKSLADFRNRKLFDFAFSDPVKVQLRNATYVKSGDKWTADSKVMENAGVQALIDKLRDLTATGFVQAAGSAPVLEISVTYNEGKRVEKVSISQEGPRFFAKRDNEPSIYEIDPKAVEELQKTAAEIKEAAPAASKK